jgi:hypothetical protein
MSVAQESRTLQLFARRFVDELKFYALIGNGTTTGKQIASCASDILRIDLRSSAPQDVINTFPLKLKNLLNHAGTNPETSFALDRHIEMVKEVSGVSG